MNDSDSARLKVQYVLKSGERYFLATSHQYLTTLPIPDCTENFRIGFSRVRLPNWAHDLGVGEAAELLVPSYCLNSRKGEEEWQHCDWWQACFSMLSGEWERHIEVEKGSIHSYAFRLPKELGELFDHAWVNRIMLFLRRWAARVAKKSEDVLFGKLPIAEIVLSHDVDALEKTIPLRLKKLAFDLFNIARLLLRGQPQIALGRLKSALLYFIRFSDYNYLIDIAELEQKFGRKSIFNVYGGAGGWLRSPRHILFDPSYDVAQPAISAALRKLAHSGFTIGLHQAFDTWRDSQAMTLERAKLSAALSVGIKTCRQHWLRFSWHETWAAQESAGFTQDTTLGFNDRPGLRNGAALCSPVWLAQKGTYSESHFSIPLVLMDSHLFDYQNLSRENRRETIDNWLEEIALVGGIASVVWHPHVFHPKDYNWGEEYEYLLTRLDSVLSKVT